MQGWRSISAAAALTALSALTACSGGNGSTSDVTIAGVQAIRVDGHAHSEGPIDYKLHPPAGGTHNPIWWNCGFYDQPVPDVNAVHDLEHGAVWLAYSPDLPAADIEVIHELARANPRVLASPYPGLKAGEAVVATAWARQLRLDSVTDPRLAQFVAAYLDGSHAPEAGASCSGTPLGTPIP